MAFTMAFIPLALLAFLAGFVDAVAGGGGLIQLPALFAVLPGAPPATLFGTNKLASIWGTLAASTQYVRRVVLPWRVLRPALVAALVGAFAGARVVSLLPQSLVRYGVLVLLALVAVYTFRRHELGTAHAPRLAPHAEVPAAVATGAVLGFYDGVFGPGTGAFLVFVFVRVFGYDFLHASAASKLVNLATNFAALAWFLPTGHVVWSYAALMAACNIAGALAGSGLAIRHGSAFVRKFFLVVVVVLIVKLAWDAVRAGAVP